MPELRPEMKGLKLKPENKQDSEKESNQGKICNEKSQAMDHSVKLGSCVSWIQNSYLNFNSVKKRTY